MSISSAMDLSGKSTNGVWFPPRWGYNYLWTGRGFDTYRNHCGSVYVCMISRFITITGQKKHGGICTPPQGSRSASPAGQPTLVSSCHRGWAAAAGWARWWGQQGQRGGPGGSAIGGGGRPAGATPQTSTCGYSETQTQSRAVTRSHAASRAVVSQVLGRGEQSQKPQEEQGEQRGREGRGEGQPPTATVTPARVWPLPLWDRRAAKHRSLQVSCVKCGLDGTVGPSIRKETGGKPGVLREPLPTKTTNTKPTASKTDSPELLAFSPDSGLLVSSSHSGSPWAGNSELQAPET